MTLKPFHLPHKLPKLPNMPKIPKIAKFSWVEVKRRPEILGIYAVVSTGLGLGTVYGIKNGFERMEKNRQIFNNTDDPDFWIEYFRLFSTF